MNWLNCGSCIPAKEIYFYVLGTFPCPPQLPYPCDWPLALSMAWHLAPLVLIPFVVSFSMYVCTSGWVFIDVAKLKAT